MISEHKYSKARRLIEQFQAIEIESNANAVFLVRLRMNEY